MSENVALQIELGDRAYYQWAIVFPLLAKEYSRQVLIRLSPNLFAKYTKWESA